MAKSQDRGHRETRKPQQELPVVGDLGVLAMPRRTNRRAARFVASVGPLWDRRRADRKARKNALLRQDAQAANPRRQHLDKALRLQMLHTMVGWSFDHKAKAFVMRHQAPERINELIDAIVELGDDTVALRVSGLSQKEAWRVRGYLGKRSLLVVLDHRLETSAVA